MKILYCIHSLYNPGGMERILYNKACWLIDHGHEVTIITTDQHDRPTFFPFNSKIRIIDLGINYSDDNGKNFLKKTLGYLKKRQLHKKKLEAILIYDKYDIVDCLYPGECSFVPKIKDHSKKVLELHQSKLFHIQYNRRGLLGLSDRIRSALDELLVKKFDTFVVLTKQDAKLWGNLTNLLVIPNSASFTIPSISTCDNKRAIAVGRLDYQKGFDKLINAWKYVHEKCPDWILDIYGQGEWKDMLEQLISTNDLNGIVNINSPTKHIGEEYTQSSMIIMSSNFEGFGMVLVEGMMCGLPAISFDCKCGPSDIIEHGQNGLLVETGDVGGLAEAIISLATDDDRRKKYGREAVKVKNKFDEERIMKMWNNLYLELAK